MILFYAVTFDVVVAADKGWGIGKDQSLPWPKLRGDLRHFKAITSTASPGKRNAIVMGRKTWQSKEVGSTPLNNRLNIVVSRSPLVVPDGVVVASSLAAAITGHDVENTFIVGGAGLLQDALVHPDLRYVYLTRVDDTYDCDIVMPDLDARGFVRDMAWASRLSGEEHGVNYRIERMQSTVPERAANL